MTHARGEQRIGIGEVAVDEIISPAGFEDFFRGFADLNDAGPIDLDAVADLAKAFGLPYAEPDWLPDVIARYSLTPPPPRR